MRHFRIRESQFRSMFDWAMGEERAATCPLGNSSASYNIWANPGYGVGPRAQGKKLLCMQRFQIDIGVSVESECEGEGPIASMSAIV